MSGRGRDGACDKEGLSASGQGDRTTSGRSWRGYGQSPGAQVWLGLASEWA